jgi:hypothetical protein
MIKLAFIIPFALLVACGDKDEDTGDTGNTDTGAEESTAGDE